ncbi:MAG: VWA domain-containing protein [Planctomycetaceae bacterium]|nr:VWA domain-containing protein [Planctomycetaceae bacterium]
MFKPFRQQIKPWNPAIKFGANRRGGMLVLIVSAIIILLIAAAIGIDVAYMHVVRAELRTATDAAARAGVEALGRTQDVNAARQAAMNFAGQNTVAGVPLQLRASDIEIGSTVGGNNSKFSFQLNGTPPTAMRVTGRRTANSLSGPVALFFGPMFGQTDFQPIQLATAARLDIDIALVLDVSGSMSSQNRFPGLVNAVGVFIQELENTPQEERCSMSVYSTDAEKAIPMTTNLQSINQRLSQLSPDGFTAIGRGMQVGLTSFSDPQARPFALRAMIVMTDGHHNTGVHPANVVNSARQQNVTVHTITFSAGANQQAMRQVANSGGGTHIHANNNAQLSEAFREIARQLNVLLIE